MKNPTKYYTKEKILEICEKGEVLYNDWRDRDSHGAQEDRLMVILLLKSDCPFKIRTKDNSPKESSCVTDEETLWIDIFFDDWEDGENWNTFYLPTEKRLKEAKGGDWY